MPACDMPAFMCQYAGDLIQWQMLNQAGCHINTGTHCSYRCRIHFLVPDVVQLRHFDSQLFTDRRQEMIDLRHLVFTKTNRRGQKTNSRRFLVKLSLKRLHQLHKMRKRIQCGKCPTIHLMDIAFCRIRHIIPPVTLYSSFEFSQLH